MIKKSYIFAHNNVQPVYKKSKILQQTFTANDSIDDGQVCYMLLLFMEGDKVVGTAAVRLYNNFHLHDEISHYQFYAFSSN